MSVVYAPRPEMGSSQLPDGGLPFGYHSNNNNTNNNLSAGDISRPPSPCNNQILNTNDRQALDAFFEQLESNFPSHDITLYDDGGLNFTDQWEFAPSLVGHVTSFGTPPPPDISTAAMAGFSPTSYQGINEQNMMPLPVPPPHPPPPPRQSLPQSMLYHVSSPFSQPSQHQRSFNLPIEQNQPANVGPPLRLDEDTKMAAVLAGLPMHSGYLNGYPPRTSSSSGASCLPVPNVQPPRDQSMSISQSHFTASYSHPVRPARSNEAHMLFTEMFYGSQGSTSQRPAEQPELNFGSDALFARNQGFVPPEHESSEALEKKRLECVREALLTSSVPNTQASSPMEDREVPTPVVHEQLNGNVKEEDNTTTPRKGGRKSRAKVDGEEGSDNAVQTPSNPARKRKPKGDLGGLPESASAGPGKRRKSALSQPKQPPRENLTDAQKRENHIRSEQKRRGAIKDGFDDLAYIVPTLDRPGCSRSSMLNTAADWLEQLKKDNDEMSSGNL